MGEFKAYNRELPMKECKFCNAPIKGENAFCHFCGYDPKTDTIRQNVVLKRKIQKEERHFSYGIRPSIRMFAFIGLAVVIFTIFYKHNFNLNGVISEVKQAWHKGRIKASKIIPMEVEKKTESVEETETFNPSVPLIVQGVIWGGAMPQAIINNRVINIGNVIEGAKVIDINKKGVVLLYKDHNYLLPSYVSKYKND